MGRPLLLILLVVLLVKAHGQEHCVQFPAKKLDILPNPSFEAGPCLGNYVFPGSRTSIPGWLNVHALVPAAYLSSCTSFTVSDSILAADLITSAPLVQRYRLWGLYMTIPPVVPLPLPDGNAVVTITDAGVVKGATQDSVYTKSYIAACLPQPLLKDSLYKLEFYLGFGQQSTHNYSSYDTFTKIVLDDGSTIDNWHYGQTYTFASGFNAVSLSKKTIAIYGKSDCVTPVKYVSNMSCLTYEGWTMLGTVTVSGQLGTWVKAAIPFIPPLNVTEFAIGPACDRTKRVFDSAYFYQYLLDNLQLYQAVVAKPFVTQAGGSVCTKNVTLQMQPAGVYKATDLQWFKNNVPVSGANGETLQVTSTINGEGYYQCRVQNDSVCLFTDSLAVFWQKPPNTNLLGNGDTTVCATDTTVLNAYAGFGATYRWQDGSTSAALTVTQPGTYRVVITNQCGPTAIEKRVNFTTCTDSLFIPGAFTPNGDNMNDVFRAFYHYTTGQYSMEIYNRFGQKLFVGNNIATGWDGTYNGIAQPTGAYVYVIRYKRRNGKQYFAKGTVTLIR